MSGIIILEDGNDIYASNMGLGGALERIGRALPASETKLATWLIDLSRRSGGFMDFDLRGLSIAHRNAFWAGVEKENDLSKDWDQDALYSQTVEVLRLFHQRRHSRRNPIEDARVEPIDLSELWFSEDPAAEEAR